MSTMEKCLKCGSEKLQALPLKMASMVLCADCRHTWTHRWANEGERAGADLRQEKVGLCSELLELFGVRLDGTRLAGFKEWVLGKLTATPRASKP